MKKKIISLMLVGIVSLGLIGCGTEGKVINNSIVTEVQINSLEPYGYKNAQYKISTDKGEFFIPNNDYSRQLKDLYNLKENTNENLIVDIIYYNNYKNEDKLYEVNEIVVIK